MKLSRQFVQIHFTPEACARIREKQPDFTDSVTFNSAIGCYGDGAGLAVVVEANPAEVGKFKDDEVTYIYPWSEIVRVKTAELAD